MALNYCQLVALVEVSSKVLNINGLITNFIFFLFLVIILGQHSLLNFKHLLSIVKRTFINYKNNMYVEPRSPKLK